MNNQEAVEKSRNTFRENMLQYAKEHSDFSLYNFIMQRADAAYTFWQNAQQAERSQNFTGARLAYLKALESLKQIDTLLKLPASAVLLEMFSAEYYEFVVLRDPNYRLIIKSPLLQIKESPGILQTELYKKFSNINRNDITYALYFAEKEGLIRREKKGRTYQLFFIRDKLDDEPLQTIQPDELDRQYNNLALRIEEAPGILQTELYKEFSNINRNVISSALYFAEKEGFIRREKKGRTYQLFFIRDKLDNEPLQTIQTNNQQGRQPTSAFRISAQSTPSPKVLPKPVNVTPEESKNALLSIIMFALIVVSLFVGPFALITMPTAVVLLVITTKKWIKINTARRKATLSPDL